MNEFTTAALGAVSGLVPVIATWVAGWMDQQRDAIALERQLRTAIDRLDFLERYLKISESVGIEDAKKRSTRGSSAAQIGMRLHHHLKRKD